ncbi:shikimate dehydrogenase [Arthrobacter cheniae]|uniref:Shikimate dehydrogenase n=1 Tax=Arthrobacter cheniae TaxID=1258888 RepID=A0A3A5MG34_9MICC|nr:shikimate dehydrogenase [Arthrobacter cheniae]RJT81908.1 shikimate dehydrogenase [Arthrobacter cheniae]
MLPAGTPAPALRAAVIGSPIGHSKSPLLHAAAYRALGIDCSYTAFDVDEAGLQEFIMAVRTTPGWRGLSVTMPLKAGVARLVDTSTEPAAILGVVNTVVVAGDAPGATLTGHNTDVAGVANALTAAGVRTPGHGVILGGGGTAAAAVAGLARLGASSAGVLVRRPDAAADLLRVGSALGIDVVLLPWAEAGQHVRTAEVVISTLPPHAGDALALELESDSGFRTRGTLLDVAYDPWPSALAAGWQRAGGTIVPGLDMLLHQAVEQVRLFFPDSAQDSAALLDVMCDAVRMT